MNDIPVIPPDFDERHPAISGRRFPHDVDIEQAVLGSALRDPVHCVAALDGLAPEDFYDPVHQRLWEAIGALVQADKTATPLIVNAAMADDEGLKEIHGLQYLRSITQAAPSLPNIAEYCRLLRELSMRRKAILLGEHLVNDCFGAALDAPTTTILADHENALYETIHGRMQQDDPKPVYDASAAAIDRLDRTEDTNRMLKLGIPEVDEWSGGLSPGDLVIMAGRPGMGKSAAALRMAQKVAMQGMDLAGRGQGVLFVSLEMGRDQLAERCLSMLAYERGHKIPYSSIRRIRVTNQEKDVLSKECAYLAEVPLIIDQKRGQTLAQIGLRARRVRSQLRRRDIELKLLVIDHLQLILPEGSYKGNKVAETTAISRNLKVLAGALGLPIVCLSQMSRNVESRDDKRPHLSDLRDSGAIEEDADQVMLLYREEYYAAKGRPSSEDGKAIVDWENRLDRSRHKLMIYGAKNRHGREADIELGCDIAYNWIGTCLP